MPVTVVVGAQWGDEGKGKVVDYYASRFDVIARYQGGNNAGHTVVVGGHTYKFQHLPSAITHKDKQCVIGNGVVIDPKVLLEEMDRLKTTGHTAENLSISDRAHVILPHHRALDEALEGAGGGIGTTKRGIGPTYSDKISRMGLRAGDLVDRDALSRRLKAIYPSRETLMSAFGAKAPSMEAVLEEYALYGERLRPHVKDTILLLNNAVERGAEVLLEGAQGTMLDVDFGTYPFVTSSSTTAGGASTGTGIPPNAVDEVIGIVKAYTTRVGSGPFPTELHDAAGEHLVRVGKEVGTVTGRKRRCGWLDLVVLKHASRVNGLTGLAITKLDVLAGLPSIKVCESYRLDGKEVREVPASIDRFAEVEPVYKELKGFGQLDPLAVEKDRHKGLQSLPESAQKYVNYVSKQLAVPVVMVSYGPRREDTLDLL
ncbi:MAG: adenylosuccinate synthase [Euryarchaeota archaeon]|nr:adenylosuccinate synthase [Euryarchaeota archaeon]